MPETKRHHVTVCTDCRRRGGACRPGLDLMGRLADGLERLGVDARSDFSIAGTACMAGCDRPCTIAFQASGKATYLFGDIEPDADIDALVAFAELYLGLPDGMTREAQRPAGLRGKTLARIPAAVLISESAGEFIQ